MSKLYTERELVMAQREAYERGIMIAHQHANNCYSDRANEQPLYRWESEWGKPCLIANDIERLAREAFPLPKVTRPRVVRVGELEYRISEGVIEFRKPCDKLWCDHAEWRDCMKWLPSSRTQDEVKALTDLLARPTEEVEE